MSHKVFVVGSINMDLVSYVDKTPKKGETVSGLSFMINTGGKGANQAAASAKQLVETRFVGAIGDDGFAPLLKKSLVDNLVDVSGLVTVHNQASGTAMIIVNEGDNRIILNQGANGLLDDKLVESSLASGNVGDILLTQNEINQNVVYRSIRLAKEKGMVTIHNPAPAHMIPLEIRPSIDYLILNETEAEVIFELDMSKIVDYKELAKVFHKHYFSNVILTLGKQGVVAFFEDKIFKLDAKKIPIVDTTAAGDTFVGVFAAYLLIEHNQVAALEKANTAAGLTCTKKGAMMSIPSKEELNHFIENDYQV